MSACIKISIISTRPKIFRARAEKKIKVMHLATRNERFYLVKGVKVMQNILLLPKIFLTLICQHYLNI